MAETKSGASRWTALLGTTGMAAFILGPLLAHFEVVPALAGFSLFGLSGLLGIVTLVMGVIAGVRSGWRRSGRGLMLGVWITITFLSLVMSIRKFPPINDITTDTANPPHFVKAGALNGNQERDMSYPGTVFAEKQRLAYPEIAPLHLNLSTDEAFKQAQKTAEGMPNWEITHIDPEAHTLEGVATTFLFRFKDDFVIEVREQEGGSIVQMRSKSRDGKGDIGTNARRIKAFFAKLRQAG